MRDDPTVAEATRARVRQVAEQMQYRPNAHAARLARGRTFGVGMAVPVFDRWYFSSVVAAAEHVLRDHKQDLLLYRVQSEARRDFLMETAPYRNRVDGLILVGLQPAEDEANDLALQGARVVMIGARTDPFSSVNVDDMAAARVVAAHLLGLGHRRVAMIVGPIDESARQRVLKERSAGFIDTVRQAGCDPVVVTGEMTAAGGQSAMADLMSRADRPTAVFAASDEMAMGALKAARDLGLDVPGDVSVVGFDDHDLAEVVDLTTINQSVPDHGRRAAELLLADLDRPHHEPEHVVIPTRLIIRRSTGPAPTS